MSKIIIITVVLLSGLVSCSSGGAQNVQAQVANYSVNIKSKFTAAEYPIHVYLPPSYSVESSRYFPIIYVTDGQWYFAMVKQMLEEKGLQVILVGVEEGEKNRRLIDYKMPGAIEYHHFFTKELMPLVEKKYRVDVSRRTIVGASYGGLFVGICMLFDGQNTQLFQDYWAFDGSFFELASAASRALVGSQSLNTKLKGRLILTGATKMGNDASVSGFEAFIRPIFPNLNINRIAFPVSHEEAVIPSFTASINELKAIE